MVWVSGPTTGPLASGAAHTTPSPAPEALTWPLPSLSLLLHPPPAQVCWSSPAPSPCAGVPFSPSPGQGLPRDHCFIPRAASHPRTCRASGWGDEAGLRLVKNGRESQQRTSSVPRERDGLPSLTHHRGVHSSSLFPSFIHSTNIPGSVFSKHLPTPDVACSSTSLCWGLSM